MAFEGVTRYLTNLDLHIQPGSRSRELVVILHGWTSSPDVMKDVRAAVCGRAETGEKAELPDADVIVPSFIVKGGLRADGKLSFMGRLRSIFSNQSCYALAWDLVCLIEAAIDERKKRDAGEYERVILIGHSIGALIVRKAVVFAHGETQDAPIQGAAARPWATKLERVILFAAMNRGWETGSRLSYMSRSTWFFLLALDLLTRRMPIAKLIRGAKRGAPFVSDLRLQWLRLAQREPSPLPATVQIRGTVDDVVQETDSTDLEAAGGFMYRTLNGGGHLSIVQISPVKHPQHAAWRRAFVEVLTAPRAAIPSDAIKCPLQSDPSIERVVFIMHGIRDYGDWTKGVASEIKRLSSHKAISLTPSYDYFPMGRFLLLGERQRHVRWFMDQYSEARAKYPAATFSFIGHSNGTYLLGSALRRYKTPIFDRVVCAGTVLPRSFPWDHFVESGRVRSIQNYVATADWVVGWFPAFFQWMAELFRREPDLGSGGHNGFLDDSTHQYAIEFVRGGHSAAIVPQNMANLALFALGRDVTPEMVPNRAGAAERSGMVDLFYKLCPIVWLLLVSAVLVFIFGPYVIGWRWAMAWLIGAVIFVWLLLMRI
jgi:alpha-beta hydrolase superfamily lysophospholipase